MEKDLGKLEPPKLFGRKKATKPASESAPEPASEPTPDLTESAAGVEPEPTPADTELSARVEPEPAREAVPPAAEAAVATEATEAPVARPARRSQPRTARPVPSTAAAEHVVRERDSDVPAESGVLTLSETASGPAQEPVSEPVPTAEGRRHGGLAFVRRPPAINGALAAAVAGLVAGVVLSGLTWAAEAATDPATSGRIQAVMVIAIFVLSVVAGAATLRALNVASAGTIAFLGSALVAVVAVVAFHHHFSDAVGATAGVVLSVVAYPLMRWVTVRYIDTAV